MTTAIEKTESLSSLKIDDILSKKWDGSLSYTELRMSELKQLREELIDSVTDLRILQRDDEMCNERLELQVVIDNKMDKIGLLEKHILSLESDLRKISEAKKEAARKVDAKRAELQNEIKDLFDYRQRKEMKKQIKGILWDIALPKEHFKEINNLLAKHQSEIERLERMKLGATPSQIALINEKIRKLEEEFNEALAKIDFQTDEAGRRYYFDENGERKYLDNFALQMDEIGDFTLDAVGNKIYTRQYATDEFGRYYLDDNVERIYKATPHSPECRLIGGVLMRIKKKGDGMDEYDDSDKEPSFPEYKSGENESLDFIMANFAVPLKLGLAQVILKQPIQPLELLEDFLIHYHKCQQSQANEEKEGKELTEARKRAAKVIFEAQLKAKQATQQKSSGKPESEFVR